MQSAFTRFLLVIGFLFLLLPRGYAQLGKGAVAKQSVAARAIGPKGPSTCSSCYASKLNPTANQKTTISTALRRSQSSLVTNVLGAYLRSTQLPWGTIGDSTNAAAMSQVFGPGNWEGFFFESASATAIFAPSRKYVFIEGGDAGALAFKAFLQANRPIVEAWVSNGGHLFMNSAPNEGEDIDLGFGSVMLRFDPYYYSTASAEGTVAAGHPISVGPFVPAGNYFTGGAFSHGVIDGPVSTVINSSLGISLGYSTWGSGFVFFGSLTTTSFHEPSLNARNLFKNILAFVAPVTCTSPTLTVPAAIVANNKPGQCGAAVAFEATATGTPAPVIVYSIAGTSINSSFVFPAGITTVTATATNSCGSDTKTFTVQVTDTERPTISAPAAISIGTSPGQCAAANVMLGQATFSDNCAGAVVSNNAPATYPKGTTAVTWTVTDAAGNKTSATQTVTVSDVEAPALTVPATIVVSASAVTAKAVVTFSPVATDNCSRATVVSTPASGSLFPLGVSTVSVMATDTDGNTTSQTFKVEVRDVTPPTVRTRNVTVNLVNGIATVAASQVDNGSSDAGGIASISLNRTSFTCANLGSNNVTLTVTDLSGNQASAVAVVTVVGNVTAPTITVTATSNVYTGGVLTNLYLGYGPQSVKLTASGGVSYVWSPATGLSSSTISNPVFTVTSAGTYTYTVTATTASGCQASATVKLKVTDAQCGNKNDKVLVCHNGHEICISPNAVSAHLTNHNDYLGSCQPSGGQNATASHLVAQQVPAAALAAEGFVLEAFPNPFSTSTTVHFRTASTTAAQVRVVDQLGRVVSVLFDGVAETGRDYQLTLNAEHLANGLYLCEFISQGKVQVQRLSVVK